MLASLVGRRAECTFDRMRTRPQWRLEGMTVRRCRGGARGNKARNRSVGSLESTGASLPSARQDDGFWAFRPFTTSDRPGQHGSSERLRKRIRSVEPWRRLTPEYAGHVRQPKLLPPSSIPPSSNPNLHGSTERIHANADGNGRSVPPHVRAKTRKLTSIRFRYAYGKVQRGELFFLEQLVNMNQSQ